MNTFDFPTQYEPYGIVHIGHNLLKNVKALVSVENNIPILIGKGSFPRVWLNIPADRTGTRWYPLIKDNFSSHKDVRVELHTKTLFINTPQGLVLSAHQSDDDTLSIPKLDLRPFGLAIYADENSLQVMGSTLALNEFINVTVAIGIGTGQDRRLG